ncbi:hypothetical protein Tco_1000682 [Tanacetum coccineum]|uniref:DUF4283 domain-containing protein n=1 Tax=Tanacetum coccineum TaxID=301880 RepID=A0ABQ4Y6J9_9ASTR
MITTLESCLTTLQRLDSDSTNVGRGIVGNNNPDVSLTTVSDLEVLIKDIDASKHEELLSGMTNDKRKVVIEALGVMCDIIETQRVLNLHNDGLIYSIDDVAALFGVPLNSPKEIDKFNKDLEVGNNALWLNPLILNCMMFLFKFLKRMGRSSFARFLIELNSEADLVDAITISIPSLTRDSFTKETICVEYEWRPHRCDICKIFGHIQDHCPKRWYEPKVAPSEPKKGATNVGNTSKLSSMLKSTGTFSKKGNITTSNSYSALKNEEEDEQHVENIYDESANLFPNSKIIESSSFTAATDLWLQVQIFYDHVDYTTQMAIDCAADGRLRKLRPKEAWETIKDLAQHEEEEWNDLIFSKKGSPDYIDATLEHELESMECRVESLMRNEVLLKYGVGFTFPKRPDQEELEARILNLIDHQEDQVRQLEEDMRKNKRHVYVSCG